MDQRIPAKLSTVSDCADHYGYPDLLEETSIILAQHFVGDLVPFVHALRKIGMQKELSWFLDIPYATNKTVLSNLRRMGFRSSHFAPPTHLGPLDSFEPTRYMRTRSFFGQAIADAISKGIRKMIFVDDGGHSALARSVIYSFMDHEDHSVAIVEQTRYGMELHRAFDLPSRLRLVNVADTPAKLRFESPVIAAVIVERIKEILDKGESSFEKGDDILILGYGNIGRAIAQSLVSDWRIPERTIYVKPDETERYFQIRRGELSPIPPQEANDRFRLVIGCTGKRAFHHSHIALLASDSLLVSATSGVLEFPKEEWILSAENSGATIRLKGREELEKSANLHQTLCFEIDGKKINLANSGYPINFSGAVNCAPPEKLQLTVALMLMGVIQAATDKKTSGEVLLRSSNERWILSRFRRAEKRNHSVQYSPIGGMTKR